MKEDISNLGLSLREDDWQALSNMLQRIGQ